MYRSKRGVRSLAIASLATYGLILPQTMRAGVEASIPPAAPLSFEANQGQTDKRVQFIARARHQTVYLTSDAMVVKFAHSAKPLRFEFRGTRGNAAPIGLEVLPGIVNYLRGRDPSRWRNNILTYERVAYRELYKGVDLVFYGKQRQFEYDFRVEPHGNPNQIALQVRAADSKIAIDRSGDLVIRKSGDELRWLRPQAYQLSADGSRIPVECRYDLRHESIGFKTGAFDASKTLVIDPVLSYSSYLGGTDDEGIFGIQRDREGNLYVAGETSSLDFPVEHPAQTTEGGDYDAFVTKFDPSGTRLIYSTYLGGSGYDHAVGLAVDPSGSAYIAGVTQSADFPTRNALQASLGGPADGFVARLDHSGSELIFSTYLGGSGYDAVGNIALDRDGKVYLSGSTQSMDFPVTAGAYQTICDNGAILGVCQGDAFVTKLDSRGRKLIYSTYLGGSSFDSAADIAVDAAGNAYVGGQTASQDFPTRAAYQGTLAGQANGFVAKMNKDGTQLIYSTYLGGSGFDSVGGIALDWCDNAYVTGSTSSPNFPTVRAFQKQNNGGFGDGFVAKLGRDGSELAYSTYLGGSGWDLPFRIGVDLFGSASVVGFTTSTDFPVHRAVQPKFAGGFSDTFVSKLNLDGSKLAYSTYLGGTGDDFGYALHSEPLGGVWSGGSTSSTDYPVRNGYQTKYAGGPYDAFLSFLRPTLLEELDGLEDLFGTVPQSDDFKELLQNVRLSIGSGSAETTANALRLLDRAIESNGQDTSASQVHSAVDQLIHQIREDAAATGAQ